MDDLLKTFAGKIEEPIGYSIEFLSVLMASTEIGIEPCIFWLKTDDGTWHRFFMDAWVPHWTTFNEEEKKDLLKEDFEEIVTNETTYYVKDLMKIFALKNKNIEYVDMCYLNRDQLFSGNLKINLQDSMEINLYDYGDKISSQLYINETLIKH